MVWLLFCWLRPGIIIISASAAHLPWAQGCLPSLGFRKSFIIIIFHLASKRGLLISPPCYWTWTHVLISGFVIHSRAKSTFDWIFGGLKLWVFFLISENISDCWKLSLPLVRLSLNLLRSSGLLRWFCHWQLAFTMLDSILGTYLYLLILFMIQNNILSLPPVHVTRWPYVH